MGALLISWCPAGTVALVRDRKMGREGQGAFSVASVPFPPQLQSRHGQPLQWWRAGGAPSGLLLKGIWAAHA